MTAKEKDCGNHGKGRRRLIRGIIGCLLVFILLVLITILIIWAVLRPTKPRFVLLDTTVYAFNTSTPNFLTSNFQATVSARNPNDRIGVYYDKLVIYATYMNQQTTLRTSLPPTYQGHNENSVWSPFVYGNMVPIAPDFSVALKTEQSSGSVFLVMKIDGRVRWKVGSFVSGRYHLHVRCPAYITFGSKSTGVKYQLVTRCSVSV